MKIMKMMKKEMTKNIKIILNKIQNIKKEKEYEDIIFEIKCYYLYYKYLLQQNNKELIKKLKNRLKNY